MDFKQLQSQLNEQITHFNQQINQLFNFVGNKLKNFKNLTLGEQISYAVIGCGLFLILLSIILFIIM
jgi:ABC-type transport system involved in cytochrome c biogenesis permease subunit